MTQYPTRRDGDVDWQAIRERLNVAEAGVKEAVVPSPERAQVILDARARILAQPSEPARSPSARLDLVLFSVGRERYGIETRFVRDVIRLVDFTPVPRTPNFILGVTNMRGTVLAIVDLRHFFNIAVKGLTDQSRVIVLGTEQIEFGILADEAHGQAEVPIEDVRPAPGEVAGIGRTYLRGVTESALIVLDGAVLLGDPRLIIDENGDPAK